MLAASHQWKGIQCDVSVKKRAEATALRGGVGVEPRLSSSGSCPLHVQGAWFSLLSPSLLLTVLGAWGFCRPDHPAGSLMRSREVARWLGSSGRAGGRLWAGPVTCPKKHGSLLDMYSSNWWVFFLDFRAVSPARAMEELLP